MFAPGIWAESIVLILEVHQCYTDTPSDDHHHERERVAKHAPYHLCPCLQVREGYLEAWISKALKIKLNKMPALQCETDQMSSL